MSKNYNTLYPKHPDNLIYPIYNSELNNGFNKVCLFRSQNNDNSTVLRDDLKKMYNANDVILTRSGSDALILSIKILGLAGKEILVLSFNCTSVIDSIYSAGAKPKMVDIDYNFRIDLSSCEKQLSNETAAIILTNTYGFAENKELHAWARKNNLIIIDDAAQGMLQKIDNKRLGGFGDVGILSFGYTKPIFALGGGALILNKTINKTINCNLNTELKSSLINEYRSYKYIKRTNMLMRRPFVCLKYIWGKFGLLPDYKLDKREVLPDICLIKPHFMNRNRMELLKYKLDNITEYERNLERNFLFLLNNHKNKNCKFLSLKNQYKPNYATLLFNKEGDRYSMSVHLAKKGIQSSWNYYPIHLQPNYESGEGFYLPNTDILWKRVLSIPFKPPYTLEDLKYISAAINCWR